MSVDERAALVNGLVEDLGISEFHAALLRDVTSRLDDDQLTKIAEALASAEAVRAKKGWIEVMSGQTTGPVADIQGTADAIKITAGMLSSGRGRLLYILYQPMQKGGEPS